MGVCFSRKKTTEIQSNTLYMSGIIEPSIVKTNNIKNSSATISNNDNQNENKYLNPDKTKQNGIDKIIKEEPELEAFKDSINEPYNLRNQPSTNIIHQNDIKESDLLKAPIKEFENLNNNDNNNNKQQNEILINNYENLDSNKNYYLICPDCNLYILNVTSVEYDSDKNDFKFIYHCPCNNSINETKEEYLYSILKEDKPICREHNNQEIKFYCENCKKQLCIQCKNNDNLDHDIKDILNKEVISFNIMNTIKEKRNDFKGFDVFKKIFDIYKIPEPVTKLPPPDDNNRISDEKKISENSNGQKLDDSNKDKNEFENIENGFEINKNINNIPIKDDSDNRNISENNKELNNNENKPNSEPEEKIIENKNEKDENNISFKSDNKINENNNENLNNIVDGNIINKEAENGINEYESNNIVNNIVNKEYKNEKDDEAKKSLKDINIHIMNNEELLDNEGGRKSNDANFISENKPEENNQNNQEFQSNIDNKGSGDINITSTENQINNNIINEEINPIENDKNQENILNNSNDNKIKNEKRTLKNFKNTKTLKGHEERIVSLIRLSSGYIATGSYDLSIKIWDITKSPEESLITNKYSLGFKFCLLEVKPDILLAGNSENIIDVFNLKDESIEPNEQLYGHQLWINALVNCDDKHFASASNDAKIFIWDSERRIKLYELEGHFDCILTMILLDNGFLCSGSADKTIRIWDWKNAKCLLYLNAHDNWVKCLMDFNSEILLSGSDDKKIKIWDKNMNNIGELVGHRHSVRSLCKIDEYYFASGSFDNSIIIWDLNEKKCVQNLYGHSSNVICVIKYDDKLISCSSDKTIKIWEEI